MVTGSTGHGTRRHCRGNKNLRSVIGWWNSEIKKIRSQVGREQRSRSRSGATAQAKAELQKSIWRAKDRMWHDYLKNLRGAEVWRAAKFANPQA